MKSTTVLTTDREWRELRKLAADTGVPLGFAMKEGARLFYLARLAEPPKRGRPRKDRVAA
jgi:hypothetical protein